jgi:hypothetical protein
MKMKQLRKGKISPGGRRETADERRRRPQQGTRRYQQPGQPPSESGAGSHPTQPTRAGLNR